jgi:amino acid adenylation domain-containing protein
MNTIPLTSAQKGLWFLMQSDPETSSAYNMTYVYDASEVCDPTRLRSAFDTIVRRHELLRAVILEHDGNPFFSVTDVCPSCNIEERRGSVENIAIEEAERAFDPSVWPLFRTTLVTPVDSDESPAIVIVFPHIIFDDLSATLIERDLDLAYRGVLSESEPSAYSLAKLAADDALDLRSDEMRGRIATRAERLRLLLSEPGLPLYNASASSMAWHYPAASVKREVEDVLLRELSKSTLPETSVYLAAFVLLIRSYRQTSSVVVCMPITARYRRPGDADLVGYFTNLAVLGVPTTGELNLSDLVKDCEEELRCALDDRDIPFPELMRELGAAGPSTLGCQEYGYGFIREEAVGNSRDSSLALRRRPTPILSIKNKLKLEVRRHAVGATVTLLYHKSAFISEIVQEMMDCYFWLLQSIINSREERIDRVKILSPTQMSSAVQGWGCGVRVDRAKYDSVYRNLEQWAAREPQRVALQTAGKETTYGTLNEKANRIAWRLHQMGVQADDRVAVMLERGADLIEVLLGVLKSGAAYVPLDPSYPRSRLDFMLSDSAPKVVIARRDSEMFCAMGRWDVLDPDDDSLKEMPATNLPRIAKDLHCAYVIYTSGSTGRPKGVEVLRRGLDNVMAAMQLLVRMEPDDAWLAVTSISFDISALEIFLPLMYGAKVVVASTVEAARGDELLRLMTAYRVTVLQATPATWRLLESSTSRLETPLRLALCGGEHWDPKLARFIKSAARRVWNVYGPTETTIWSTAAPVDGAGPIVLGTPLANECAYVLNDSLDPIPSGAAGELYLGGVGLARGYLSRPALTAERFLPDPFTSDPGARLYRTGDLVRRLPDGSLEYLGRLDHQVKLRGYRIELGEVESLLCSDPHIVQGVVAVKELRSEAAMLVAYVVVQGAWNAEATKARLQSVLPEYMVPMLYVRLDQFPLTQNGKLDRMALPFPMTPDEHADEPVKSDVPTDTERSVIHAFAEVLGVQNIRPASVFFHLGGHSLLAVRASNMIQEEFGFNCLQMLFELRTVAEIANHIEKQRSLGRGAWTASSATIGMRPSRTQLYLWRDWEQSELLGFAYLNFNVKLEISADIDRLKFRSALAQVLGRHDVFHTYFKEDDSGVGLLRSEKPQWRHGDIDLSGDNAIDQERKLSRLSRHHHKVRINLRRGAIVHTLLLTKSPRSHIFMFSTSMALMDQWSWRLLTSELFRIYDAKHGGGQAKLGTAPEFYELIAEHAAPPLSKDIAYWQELLRDLPIVKWTDRPKRPRKFTFEAGVHRFSLSAAATKSIEALSKRHRRSEFLVILAALFQVITKVSDASDLCIGSIFANRTSVKEEAAVGLFRRVIAFRLQTTARSYKADLAALHRQLGLALATPRVVPAEDLKPELDPQGDDRAYPIQVFYQHIDIPIDQGLGLGASARPVPNREVALTDVLIETYRSDKRIEGRVVFYSSIFDSSWADALHQALDDLVCVEAADVSSESKAIC